MRAASLFVFVLLVTACGDLPGEQGATDLGMPAVDQAPDLNPCPSLNLSSGEPSEKSCSSGGLVCSYFEAKLVCRGGMWDYCWSGQPVMCPAGPPQTGADCGGGCQTVTPCTFACVGGMTARCSCFVNRWSCEDVPCTPDGGMADGG